MNQLENKKWVSNLNPHKEFILRIDALNFDKRIQLEHERNAMDSQVNDARRLTDLIEVWYRLHGQNLRDGKGRYQKLHIINDKLGKPIASMITTETFAHYREARSREVSTATVNREHTYLRALFNELKRLGVIDYENPLQHIRQFKEKDHKLRFLTSDEIDALLLACKYSNSDSVLLVVKICLATGARWSEAEELRASQLIGNQITFTNTKSNKNRHVPISPELSEELYQLGKVGDERFFTGCIGGYQNAIKKAKIQLPRGQQSHVLRHTFASHFVMNGGNIVVLKDILGHSSITTTMRYSHLSPDYLNDAVSLNPLNNPAI
ncbi:tyrosine-type recombinase/integrase [Photobacterium damselae]